MPSFVTRFSTAVSVIYIINTPLRTSCGWSTKKLFAINGSSVSLRQIRDDIRYMKDPDALNAPH